MNYAFMSFSTPELKWNEMLSTAKRYGYQGVEPRIDSGHEHGVELSAVAVERLEIKNRAADHGISICCIATSLTYANPATANASVETTLRCIDLAADVGSSRIRAFGGLIPDSVSRNEAIDLLVKSLSRVADYAKARGVTVCMETHDDWCNPKYLVKVMEMVNHPAIAINWDIMHPFIRAHLTMEEAFDIVSPWIGHVHFHDTTYVDNVLQLVCIGKGAVDHKTAVRLLKEINYDGYLSGEWINWDSYESHLPKEIATMLAYEREV